LKERYVVHQIARTPQKLVHVVLMIEGGNAKTMPLPKNDDERQIARMMEANTSFNPFFQMMEVQMPKPSVSLMLTQEQFEALGRISVGDTLEVSVSFPSGKPEPNDLTSDGT
jgi:hypothetical protein